MKNKLMIVSLILCAVLFFCSCASARDSYSNPSSSSPLPPQSGEALLPSTAEEEYDGRYNGDFSSDKIAEGESYLNIIENRSIPTAQESMLTFSLKVDTASYTNTARYIENGSLPPAAAVRTEELINYFAYDTPMTFGDEPFALCTEVAPSPYDASKYMAFIRVKTPEIDKDQLPSSNLTFLIDTSGSMDSYDKLPLLKSSFSMLVETLDKNDRISIVTYAGSSSVVLEGASGNEKDKIIRAINHLEAGGSTAGADGIITAYELAEKHFLKDGNNRVILATDGDFNVGPSGNGALSKLIQTKRDSGVYLSILGFGTGNIRDDLMETLSKDGNGNYAYINSIETAKKVLVEELASNLFIVADDVKAQIEFNPQHVNSYRLIGYENRALANRDFDDDTKDAGEIGVGTDVVILFELDLNDTGVAYKYSNKEQDLEQAALSEEMFEVRIRYKNPGQSVSKLVTSPLKQSDISKKGSSDLNFACAVMGFGDLLRGSQYAENINADDIFNLAADNLGKDQGGYRKAFLKLLSDYKRIAG